MRRATNIITIQQLGSTFLLHALVLYHTFFVGCLEQATAVSVQKCGNAASQEFTVEFNRTEKTSNHPWSSSRTVSYQCIDAATDVSLCQQRDIVSGRNVRAICSNQCLIKCQELQQRRRRRTKQKTNKKNKNKKKPKQKTPKTPSQHQTNKNLEKNQQPSQQPASIKVAAYLPTPAPTFTPSATQPPQTPIITSQSNSLVVTLPNPVAPDLSAPRSNCPHYEAGLLNWNDASTWGGVGVPGLNDNVTLPLNSRVLLNETIYVLLGVITIPASSELIIGEVAHGISLDVHGIIVEGKLTVGATTCRLETPVTITLHGSRPADAVNNRPDPSYKGISVAGGQLNLHGKQYFQTWTRLAQPVKPGNTTLYLQNAVNWELGQQIVLVTSALLDSPTSHENEVLTVASVASNPPPGVGAVVYLQEPVQYAHFANLYYQVEVGLLSRMITVQGSAYDSVPSSLSTFGCASGTESQQPSSLLNGTSPCLHASSNDGYGGHILVWQEGGAQIEGVQLLRMGQTNLFARYPITFYMLGDCSHCFIKDSAVYQSYYRCVALYGTNQVNVTQNVAYDVIGNCYTLESGTETNNVLSYNLGALIHLLGPNIPGSKTSKKILAYQQTDNLTNPADATAAAFFITNVQNTFVGNAASGVSINVSRCMWQVLSFCWSQLVSWFSFFLKKNLL